MGFLSSDSVFPTVSGGIVDGDPGLDVIDKYVETDPLSLVLHRKGLHLVASGVQMEAFSVEDEGEGICFNVYVYNVQPGITIDYATGDSWEN